MFGIMSKCSFRNNSCISNWQSSERGSVAAASLTDCAPYDVSQKNNAWECAAALSSQTEELHVQSLSGKVAFCNKLRGEHESFKSPKKKMVILLLNTE